MEPKIFGKAIIKKRKPDTEVVGFRVEREIVKKLKKANIDYHKMLREYMEDLAERA